MTNPILVETTRGAVVESTHLGRYAIVGPGGELIASAGDIAEPIFPRSAIKAFQCLPAVEAGVVEEFDLSEAEISLACASHNGEPEHVETALSVLQKANLQEDDYECGSHWPSYPKATHALAASGDQPRQVHNNCSGKHAMMLAFCRKLGVDPAGYIKREHPLQQIIEKVMGEMCEIDLTNAPCGMDGCSLPNWAMPLENMAKGFQKFASGEGLSDARAAACQKIIAAVRAHPFMVAGSERNCTKIMEAVPRVFVKIGAEGVYCASVPHAGIGVALKMDDGASRAADVCVAGLLAGLDCWTEGEKAALQQLMRTPIINCEKRETGEVRAVPV